MAKTTTYRILAFDPGTTHMGWAVIDYDYDAGVVTVFKYGTLHGASIVKQRKDRAALFTKQYVIVDAYEEMVAEMIGEYKPDEVVAEGAFQARFPQAYAALLLVIHAIRKGCDAALGRDIHIVAPSESKQTVAKDHQADKPAMRKAVLEHPKITIKSTKQAPIEEADEHVFDAIAHGATFAFLKLPALLAIRSLIPA